MSDSYPRARPGGPLRIAAGWYNAASDATDAYQRSRENLGAADSGVPRETAAVKVRNTTGAALDAFSPVALGAATIGPAQGLSSFLFNTALDGKAPSGPGDARDLAVLLEPLADGAVGLAAVAGIVPCRLRSSDSPAVGDSFGFLTSDTLKLGKLAEGPARVVAVAGSPGDGSPGAGSIWALVHLDRVGTGGYRYTSTPSATANVVDVTNWDAVKYDVGSIAGLSGPLSPERLVTVLSFDPSNPEGTNGTWADLAGLWDVWNAFPGVHPYRPILVTAVSTPDGWVPVAAHAGATPKYLQMGHRVANKFGATTDAPIKIGYGDADDEDTFDRIIIVTPDFQPWTGGPLLGPLFSTGRGHQFLLPDVPVLGVDDPKVCLTFDHFAGMGWDQYFSSTAIGDIAADAASDVIAVTVPGLIATALSDGGYANFDYVDSQDAATLSSANGYTDSALAGFDKTAIVPLTGGGFVALFCVEAPEVRFEDVVRVPLKAGRAVVPIDPRFLDVCEPGSVEAVSACPSSAAAVGARVEAGRLVVEADRPVGRVTVKLSGIRKGRGGARFPACTREQMEANNDFHALAHPGVPP